MIRLLALSVLFALASGLFALAATAASAGETVNVSQKGKAFHPERVEITAGSILRVDNDDRVLHHLYVESPTFNFDSGEQEPGHRVDIKFDKAGRFEIRCDIHPKMLLEVVVR